MNISADKERKKDTDILAQDSRLLQGVHSIFIYIFQYSYYCRDVSVSCAPQKTKIDSHKQVVYFLERGHAVRPGGQRLRMRGARLDMEEFELVASFSVDDVSS